MSMIRVEEVLCELMRGPECQRDVIVRSYLQSWRAGHAPADQVLLQLVRALSEQNRRLMDIATRAARLSPVGFVLEAPERVTVPITEAMPGDPVYYTPDGELVAKQRADARAAWKTLQEGLKLKPAADAPIITGPPK